MSETSTITPICLCASCRCLSTMMMLRDEGWLVVLKVVPKEQGYLLGGSRSEYDGPERPLIVGKGKWLAEAQWMGEGPYRHSEVALDDSASAAMAKVITQIREQGR